MLEEAIAAFVAWLWYDYQCHASSKQTEDSHASVASPSVDSIRADPRRKRGYKPLRRRDNKDQQITSAFVWETVKEIPAEIWAAIRWEWERAQDAWQDVHALFSPRRKS